MALGDYLNATTYLQVIPARLQVHGFSVLPVWYDQFTWLMFRQCGETIEVDLGDVFAANFRVVGISLLGPERQNLQFRSGVTRKRGVS